MCPFGQILWVTSINTSSAGFRSSLSCSIPKPPFSVVPLQAQEIEVIVITDQGVVDHRIKRINDILPNGFATRFDIALFTIVRDDHSALSWRNPRSFPSKPFCAHYPPVQWSTQENSPYLGPQLLLLFQGLRLAQLFDVKNQSKESKEPANKLDCVPDAFSARTTLDCAQPTWNRLSRRDPAMKKWNHD